MTANGLLSSRLSLSKCFLILLSKAMETFQRIKESTENQIFSINAHHQNLLTFQRAMDLVSTCWNERSFWALIATLSSLRVLYFAIRIRQALSPKIQHESKISLDIVLVELELEVIGVRILAFGKFRNLIHRPPTLWQRLGDNWRLHPLHSLGAGHNNLTKNTVKIW